MEGIETEIVWTKMMIIHIGDNKLFSEIWDHASNMEYAVDVWDMNSTELEELLDEIEDCGSQKAKEFVDRVRQDSEYETSDSFYLDGELDNE